MKQTGHELSNMDELRGNLAALKTRPAGKTRDKSACDLVDAFGGPDSTRIPLRVAAVRFVNEHPEHHLDACIRDHYNAVQRDGGIARHTGHETGHGHSLND